jgi:hypothetical protein
MFSTLLHKRSLTPSSVPSSSDLSGGEIAINVADGKLFIKDTNDNIKTFLNVDQQPYTLDQTLSSVNFQYGNNTVTDIFASVLNGVDNDVSGGGSTVINGSDNDIAADYALIGNGSNNKISVDGDYGAILGGENNNLNHPNSFILGSNITSHLSGFTYVENLSANGKFYGDGSELTGIISGDTEATTLVRQNSASWGTGGVTQNLSFDENTSDLSLTSGNTISLSSLAGAGGDPEATTLVRSNSANWDSVYTSYNSNSASFATTSYVDGNYVPLSGATLTGTLNAPTLSATDFYGSGSNVTNLNASNITSGIISVDRLPAFNGDITTDISTGSVSATVVAIQGEPISTQYPNNGQVLQWNGTTWTPGTIPTGGSGGGGLTYYLNYANEAQSPTTNLSATPNTPKELGTTGVVATSAYTLSNVSTTNYSLICGFVSLTGNPNTTVIPSGLWDFNIWASSTATVTNQMILRLYVYKYDGSNSPTLLASSDDFSIYDPSVIAQYIASVVFPQTPILATDRIYLELRAKGTQHDKSVTIHFGGATPSHVHTTLPSVGGSGLVKVIDGVYQSPASLLVNSDVASNAAIDQSKISGLTDVASKASTTYTTVQSNSATTWNYQGTDLKALSGNWQNTYTTVQSKSANWDSSYTTVQSNSANWQTTFSASSSYIPSIPTGLTGASQVTNIIRITQAGYSAISSPLSGTLYIIVG